MLETAWESQTDEILQHYRVNTLKCATHTKKSNQANVAPSCAPAGTHFREDIYIPSFSLIGALLVGEIVGEIVGDLQVTCGSL